MLLEDSGPVGGMFSHAGKTYQIKPNFFCSALLKKIKARIKQLDREQAKEILMDTTSHPDIREAAIKQSLRSRINFPELFETIQDLDVLPIWLSYACSITPDEADALVLNYPNPVDLMIVLVESSGLDTLKNSDRLRTAIGEAVDPQAV